jgi:hypothetical protein
MGPLHLFQSLNPMIILPIKYPKLTSVFQSHLRRALLRGHHLPDDALGHPGFTRYNAREVSRGLRCHCGTGYDRVVSKASATPLRDTLPPLTHLAHGQITFRPSSMTSASSNASLLSAVSTRPITVHWTHPTDTFSARMVRIPRRPYGHSRPGEYTHRTNELPSLTHLQIFFAERSVRINKNNKFVLFTDAFLM